MDKEKQLGFESVPSEPDRAEQEASPEELVAQIDQKASVAERQISDRLEPLDIEAERVGLDKEQQNGFKDRLRNVFDRMRSLVREKIDAFRISRKAPDEYLFDIPSEMERFQDDGEKDRAEFQRKRAESNRADAEKRDAEFQRKHAESMRQETDSELQSSYESLVRSKQRDTESLAEKKTQAEVMEKVSQSETVEEYEALLRSIRFLEKSISSWKAELELVNTEFARRSEPAGPKLTEEFENTDVEPSEGKESPEDNLSYLNLSIRDALHSIDKDKKQPLSIPEALTDKEAERLASQLSEDQIRKHIKEATWSIEEGQSLLDEFLANEFLPNPDFLLGKGYNQFKIRRSRERVNFYTRYRDNLEQVLLAKHKGTAGPDLSNISSGAEDLGEVVVEDLAKRHTINELLDLLNDGDVDRDLVIEALKRKNKGSK